MTQITSSSNEVIAYDTTGEQPQWPIGPEVEFTVIEYDFKRLVRELVRLEQKHDWSTLEVFDYYLHGKLHLDKLGDEFEEWLGLFFLFLGTEEVQRYSCRDTRG